MSFRLFIYYCAMCGAWAALIGWGLGRLFAPESGFARAPILAMILGVCVAFALSLLDTIWNHSGRLSAQGFAAILVALIVGLIGGLIGGTVGQALFNLWEHFQVVGWLLTGLLIGASIGAFEILLRFLRKESIRGALRKIINGTIGGMLGGLIGSIMLVSLGGLLAKLLDKPKDELLSSSLVGYVALGMFIGLLIGLAQVILKEAWIRVESGFRPGRELILSKPETLIGRAEGCDIGLFGGRGVEKQHARIVHRGNDYLVVDAQTPGGTFVNDQKISGTAPLKSGDRVRVGNCVLLFQERRKEKT